MINPLNMIKNKKIMIITSLAAIGILLLCVSNQKPKTEIKENFSQDFDTGYIKELESRIEAIISTIDGAGECDVMINVSSTAESVYVNENKESYNSSSDSNESESENKILTMKDSNGNQFAVITKKLMPKISGAIITCDGGGDLTVRSLIIDAVSTVLGIGTNNVCVIPKS